MHRIKSDELWHFYAGAPLRVVEIAPDGSRLDHVLGPALHGFSCQAVVRAGNWFGAYVDATTGEHPQAARYATEPDACDWSLVGCTVAPGFDFADFEMAERSALVERYPRHRAVIERLTR